jgi:hypothetical protein
MSWIPFAVLLGGVLLYLWLISGAMLTRRTDYKESIRVYREHLEKTDQAMELTRENNRLRVEETAALRELVAELRAGRQAPGAPPTRPSDSN